MLPSTPFPKQPSIIILRRTREPIRLQMTLLLLGNVAEQNKALFGADPSTMTASGLWPSDHAGVAAQNRYRAVESNYPVGADCVNGGTAMMQTNGRLLVDRLVTTIVMASLSGCGGASNTQPPPPPPISVSLSATAAKVQPNASAQFTATVSNDSSSKGVTWSMTCNGATCGSISPAATASGAPTTFTGPNPPGVTLIVKLVATSVADTTKSNTVTITVPAPTTVSVSPGSATVGTGGTQQFTATVGNDPANGGVTWQLFARLWCNRIFAGKCYPIGEQPVIYLPCSGCGTLSPASSASGAPMLYTAPAHLVPPIKPGYFFCGVCAGDLQIVATSATYTGSSATASLTVLPVSVTLSPASASVALNATQQFTATVKNDANNAGVTWSVTQNGVACAPACGTISPASTPSSVAATYTAPASSPALPSVIVRATSVEDATKSGVATVSLTTSSGSVPCGAGSGSESLLNGQYAFLLHGFDSNGDMAILGSFTADGTGKITGGEVDRSFIESGVSINPSGSSYAVSPDHRGCLVLAKSDNTTTYYRFALGSINGSGIALAGHIIEFDDPNGSGQRAAGTIRLQDPSSFSASQFKGNYVIGLLGRDSQNGRIALAGTFLSDGTSAISSGTFDANEAGTITANFSLASGGYFTCCDSSGRGTLTVQGTSTFTMPAMAFYMVNSGDIFLLSTDTSILSGEALSISPGTIFSQSSLNGASVLRETARSSSSDIVDIATISADGKSAITSNDNTNSAGTFTNGSTQFNYSVAANGRVTLTGGSTPPVLYLYGPNQGFLVGTDPDVTFGILEPQAAGPFSNASFSGAYVFGTEYPSASTVTMESGVLTADGSGNAAGTADQSSPQGLMQNQSLNLTYSLPANGVGNVGSNTTAILISGNKLVFINNTDANPTITVVQK